MTSIKNSVVQIVCQHCSFAFERDDVVRQCSNCFACTGCEIYLCPSCGDEIVVKPIGEPRRRSRLSDGEAM